jgi:peptidoglycan/LPS O-acetylase OafA/YrhL
MQQIRHLIGDTYGSLPHWVTFPLAVVAVIAVASASYYLVERPFYRLRSYRQLKGG